MLKLYVYGKSDITTLPNVNTLQCILTVVGTKCKVSFDVPNSLASVLGFKQSTVYRVGSHGSENLVYFMSVNSIPVHCNIIHSSYMRGTQAPVAYNFSQMPLLGKYTRSATQFNLPPSDCRRYFNFVSVVDGSKLRALHLRERSQYVYTV